MVWGIASDDDLDTLLSFRDQMGLTFPILYDEDGSVHAQYVGDTEFQGTKSPEDWVIGIDGTIKYYNGAYDAAAIKDILDDELAKIP